MRCCKSKCQFYDEEKCRECNNELCAVKLHETDAIIE